MNPTLAAYPDVRRYVASDSAATGDLTLLQTSTTRHPLVGQQGAAGLLKRGLVFVEATQRIAGRKLLYQDLPLAGHALRVKSDAVQGAQLVFAGMVQLNNCAGRQGMKVAHVHEEFLSKRALSVMA